MSIFKRQTGETIVEVLVAIVILSGALAVAFAISNRSQRTTLANQLRYQAQVYANEQADLLRAALADPANQQTVNGYTNESLPFCVNGVEIQAQFTYDPNTIPTDCKRTYSTGGITYDILVYPRVSGGETRSFLIKIQWDSPVNKSNNGKDNVQVGYGV